MVADDLAPSSGPHTAKCLSIKKEYRDHCVTKLVNAMCPELPLLKLLDKSMDKLIASMQNIEEAIYKKANNKTEYDILLADSISKLRKHAEETTQKKREQSQIPQQTSIQMLNGSTYGSQVAAPGPVGTVNMSQPNLPAQPSPNQMATQSLRVVGAPNTTNRLALEDKLRSFCVIKLLRAIHPELSLLTILDKSMEKMVARMRRIEANIHEKANTRSEYYELLADVLPKLEKEREEIIQKKREWQLQEQLQFLSLNQGERFKAKSSNNEISIRHISKENIDPNFKEVIEERAEIVNEAGDLQRALKPTLEKLLQRNSVLFSTIKKKLDEGVYNNPWEYIDNVWDVFENIWSCKHKISREFKQCTELSKIFEVDIDPVMQSLGYCCGRKYTFNPQVLCCYGKQLCTIPRNAKYFSYQNEYNFCQKCFNGIQGDTVTLAEDPLQLQTAIKKEQFKKMKNDHLEQEPFVVCMDCGRKQHQICVLHHEQIWPQGFCCDNCLKKKGAKRKENEFCAKKLPISKLSNYIEKRVNNFLKKKEAGAGEVHIRVVASLEKIMEVLPRMRSMFVDSGELSPGFPYRAKALFAFQEVDGKDICFFGMHVHEYGSDSPAPNTSRVYISYLDSVHFFQPRQYRTAVYHEILLGYLDYAKQLGYTMAHIWASPPYEGDDYIFYCHPPEQKIPKDKRLQEWYKKMLDKGIIERIILDYKDILKQAKEDNISSAAELPYFQGDLWPKLLEESIEKLEEKNKQIQMKTSKTPSMQKQKSDLNTNIFAKMKKMKESFLVIRLHSTLSGAGLATIQDPDPLVKCELMDGRDPFLMMAQDRYYEFASTRRAFFSTLCMVFELHSQIQTGHHCHPNDVEVDTDLGVTFPLSDMNQISNGNRRKRRANSTSLSSGASSLVGSNSCTIAATCDINRDDPKRRKRT